MDGRWVTLLGTFRLEYEYEIECEDDFSNFVPMLLIITFYSNLVPIVSYSTGQQQGGVRALGRNWIEIRKSYSFSNLKVPNDC